MSERRYAMLRVAKGVWLLPANDQQTLWRISAYEENGSLQLVGADGNRKTVRGSFWETARRPMPAPHELGRVDEDWLWDVSAWESWSFAHPTRREALEEIERHASMT